MRYKDSYDEDLVRAARAKIALAFRALRRKNIRARANFMCCSGCASSALDLKGKAGGVVWHRQSEDGFKQSGTLYIGFCTESGEGAKEIGEALANALKEQGLDVEWSGSADTKVRVYAEGARKAEKVS